MECPSEYTEESIEKRNLNIALFCHNNTKSRPFLLPNISLTICSLRNDWINKLEKLTDKHFKV